jgi:hypothetical protein
MSCHKVSVYWPLVGEQSPMTQDLCPEIENIDKDPLEGATTQSQNFDRFYRQSVTCHTFAKGGDGV